MPRNHYKANIMLIGKTGAGKSEFINYLIGDNAARTGCGEPVTMDFDEYEYSFKNRFTLKIFDSKGLEVDSYNEISEEIIEFVKLKNGSENIQDWIHIIFYCINIDRARLEPYEEKFITNIQEAAGYRIPIILTHSKGTSNDANNESLKKRIKERLGDNTRVYFVNSKSETLRSGDSYQQFGKESIMNELFDNLWDNSARVFSRNYAHQMRIGLVSCIKESTKRDIDLIDSSRISAILDSSAFEGEGKRKDVTKSFMQRMGSLYDEKIEEFLELYGSFSDAFGHMEYSISSPSGLADRVFHDESMVDEIYEIARRRKEPKKRGPIQRIIDIIFPHRRISDEVRNGLKEFYREVEQLYLKRVPSEKQIEEEIYAEFAKAKEESKLKSPKVRKYKKISANDPCPCGSGKKFKKCCKGKGLFD